MFGSFSPTLAQWRRYLEQICFVALCFSDKVGGDAVTVGKGQLRTKQIGTVFYIVGMLPEFQLIGFVKVWNSVSLYNWNWK